MGLLYCLSVTDQKEGRAAHLDEQVVTGVVGLDPVLPHVPPQLERLLRVRTRRARAQQRSKGVGRWQDPYVLSEREA